MDPTNEARNPANASAPDAVAAARRARFWKRVRWSVRGGALLAIAGFVLMGADGCFYFPTRTVYFTPKEFNLAYEDARFRASDGVQLAAWFIPAQQSPPRGTVIHFHGNAENMTSHISFVAWLPTRGFNLLTFDYRGYGASEGRVTRAGTVRDGLAAVDYVLSRPDVDPRRVFIFGQSLGGAVAMVVAAQRPQVRAIVVDSTFGSYREIAALHLRRRFLPGFLADGLAWLLVSGQYEPRDYLGTLAPRPLLVIQSGQDEICPPELSDTLFAAARERKAIWRVPEAGHTEGIMMRDVEFQSRVIDWFEAAVGDASSSLPAEQRP
ncbi:MAG: alpha/beta hydrolase [Phycisphaerae bacterium]